MEHIKRLIILGDNILDTVNSAVQCENYRMLSHDIREQANFSLGRKQHIQTIAKVIAKMTRQKLPTST